MIKMKWSGSNYSGFLAGNFWYLWTKFGILTATNQKQCEIHNMVLSMGKGRMLRSAAVLYNKVYINSFFYNVFRATRYKTTSLPAALNQARRIDTSFAIVFMYMQCINWSCIFWRPLLCIVLLQARKQITNKNTRIIAGFSFCVVFFRKKIS
jgi:hypothetical protein